MLFKIFLGACVLAMTVMSGLLVAHSLDLTDQSECLTWQQQADAYPAFYLTQAEAEQCRYWNIQVNAPVKFNYHAKN